MAAHRALVASFINRGECSGALDAEDVAPPAARRTEQMQPSQSNVLLISADHVTCQWMGLRALLHAEPDLHVLADMPQATEIVRVVADQHPDHVLIDAAVGGIGLVPLVRQVRRASSASRVVVIGTKGTLHRDTLLQLIEQGTRGYLLWEGLDEATVVRCLAAVREDDVLAGHRAVLEELLASPERRRRSHNDEPTLTDDERAVLSLLVGGWTQPETAAALHMSEVSVKRMVSALRAKFGVRTTNALCWQAGRLGFVPLPQANDNGRSGTTPFPTGSGQIGDQNWSYL